MKNVSRTYSYLRCIQTRCPDAYAVVKGSPEYPRVYGTVSFYQVEDGVLVLTQINYLPVKSGKCAGNIFAMHIHEGNCCSGNDKDPFADAKSHYNPCGCEHPYHAGDLPPLFENNGYAWSLCLADRFWIHEIIGKTVIIHRGLDDFTTQPAGNAGEKMACGVIVRSS